MARNKYPEVTAQKVLDASKRLFLEKGYDNTTIQDIVDELGGLTKGAIYHHFKSKEEIMSALGDKLFFDNNPFEAVRGRKDLNGLEKIREMLIYNQSNTELENINIQSLPLLKNPRVLAAAIEENRKVLTPLWLELLEEARRDGSIQTEYAQELASFLTFLNFWFLPTVYPSTAEELRRKFFFAMEMLSRMGLPLLNDKITALAEKQLADLLPDQLAK